MQFKIYEENMERLEKKIARISKKCEKYGNYFRYEVVGEEFVEKYDEELRKDVVLRYVIVEAEGTAIINNWRFIALVEHTGTTYGNVIKSCCDIEVPERYYTNRPICEHCKSNRPRKDTYIVQNIITGEFKQVGKSCLMDFTYGMSAEGVARYISLFDELIQGEAIEPGCHKIHYIDTKTALCYIAETIRHFGYVKADGVRSTKHRAMDYYSVRNGFSTFVPKCDLKEEMESVEFDPFSDYANEMVSKVLEWIPKQEESSNYYHNLKTVCTMRYIGFDKFGILASLFPAYDKAMERERQIISEKENEKNSEYVGNVGDRVTIEIADHKVITSWETEWGMTMIHKITDTNGNIYTWKTSKGIDDKIKKIVGTIKDHIEYYGAKQTVITRCRTA